MIKIILKLNKKNLTLKLCGVEDTQKYIYAYYFFINNEVIKKVWYSENIVCEIPILESGVYKASVFMKEKGSDDNKPIVYTSEEYDISYRGGISHSAHL